MPLARSISPIEYGLHLKLAKYTVSPPGVGWDCYRTWEAVLLGSIPIVMYRPSMASLYSRSPVMVVEDWSQVTVESLLGYRVPNTSQDVVFADHWLDMFDKVVLHKYMIVCAVRR